MRPQQIGDRQVSHPAQTGVAYDKAIRITAFGSERTPLRRRELNQVDQRPALAEGRPLQR